MTALAAVALAGIVFAVLFGDAAVASGIAGLFSVVNTVIGAWLLRRVGQTRSDVGSAADAAASAAIAAAEAARVAKAIGSTIRHEDALTVVKPPEPPA